MQNNSSVKMLKTFTLKFEEKTESFNDTEGIGKAKTEKYGKNILQIISSYGKPVSSEEDAND